MSGIDLNTVAVGAPEAVQGWQIWCCRGSKDTPALPGPGAVGVCGRKLSFLADGVINRDMAAGVLRVDTFCASECLIYCVWFIEKARSLFRYTLKN